MCMAHYAQLKCVQHTMGCTLVVCDLCAAHTPIFTVYTLRNVHTTDFNNPTSLKTELFTQLDDEVVSGTLDRVFSAKRKENDS